jgi:hypothetical protein
MTTDTAVDYTVYSIRVTSDTFNNTHKCVFWKQGQSYMFQSYFGGARFESRPEHWLSWLRSSWFSSTPEGKWWDSTWIRLRPLLSKYLLHHPIHHSPHHLTLYSLIYIQRHKINHKNVFCNIFYFKLLDIWRRWRNIIHPSADKPAYLSTFLPTHLHTHLRTSVLWTSALWMGVREERIINILDIEGGKVDKQAG